MSYRPRIFISHSAKEPEAKSLCRAIADELIRGEFDVLWDQNLQTSQAWRSVVDEWIWRCDGAVLVLSQAATESRYFAYEAALLRQRWKNAAGQFLLIPIWCPGVTHAILTDRMGALQLSEIQTNIRLDGWPLDAPNAFNDVCRQAVARLTTLQASIQARHDVEDLLIKQLNHGTPNEEALREIATQYNLAPMPTGSKKDLAATLARHILDFAVPLGPKRFEVLVSGIDTMMAAISDARDRVPRIVNLVAPFCWVSPASAIRVAALSALPPGQVRAIAWKRSWLLSERMYVYRGYCTRSKAKLKIANASDGAGGTAASILEHIRSVLAREVCHDQGASEIGLASKIRDLAKQSVPVFLILPARAAVAGILSEVFGRWPDICVFLFGEELDVMEVNNQFPGVELVDPPLSGEDESAARTGWGECMDAAGIPYSDLESGAAFFT
jgi:hypothetical protein